jgi:pre-mRNA-processing factor 6
LIIIDINIIVITIMNRDQWLKEAELAEQSGALETCKSLIINTIHLGVDEEDRKVYTDM